jgi:hypothetical protein
MDDLNKSIYRTGYVHSKRCKSTATQLRSADKRMMYFMLKCAVNKPEMYKNWQLYSITMEPTFNVSQLNFFFNFKDRFNWSSLN